MKYVEIINNKSRHNLLDAKCRWRSNWLDGAVSFREPLGQIKVMQMVGDNKPPGGDSP